MLFGVPYLCCMTEIEANVLESLVELERAVEVMSAAKSKPNLLPIFSRIEALTKQLPPGTEPQLMHFLHRKSYQKARVLLQELAAR